MLIVARHSLIFLLLVLTLQCGDDVYKEPGEEDELGLFGGKGGITGKIGEPGKFESPQSGVRVVLNREEKIEEGTRLHHRETSTDGSGLFSFMEVPSGEYDLIFYHQENEVDKVEKLKVTEGEVVDLKWFYLGDFDNFSHEVDSDQNSQFGTGSDVVLCKNEVSRVTKIELLEVYEAKNVHRYQVDFGPKNLNTDERVNFLLSRLRQTDLELGAAMFLRWKDLKKKIKMVGDVRFKNVEDSSELIRLPEGCSFEQVATYKEKNLLINKSFWDLMDTSNRAALIVKEIYFSIATEKGHEDSFKVRKFVAKLIWDQFSKISRLNYVRFVRKHKLPGGVITQGKNIFWLYFAHERYPNGKLKSVTPDNATKIKVNEDYLYAAPGIPIKFFKNGNLMWAKMCYQKNVPRTKECPSIKEIFVSSTPNCKTQLPGSKDGEIHFGEKFGRIAKVQRRPTFPRKIFKVCVEHLPSKEMMVFDVSYPTVDFYPSGNPKQIRSIAEKKVIFSGPNDCRKLSSEDRILPLQSRADFYENGVIKLAFAAEDILCNRNGRYTLYKKGSNIQFNKQGQAIN